MLCSCYFILSCTVRQISCRARWSHIKCGTLAENLTAVSSEPCHARPPRDMENGRHFAALLALAAVLLLRCPSVSGGVVTNDTPGIRCVQCISESSRACIDTPPAARPCDAAARYCIVVRESLLHNASVVTVTRTCSPVDLGSKCHDSFSLAGESVLVCHEACDTDGCNGARPQPAPASTAATPVAPSLALCVLALARAFV